LPDARVGGLALSPERARRREARPRAGCARRRLVSPPAPEGTRAWVAFATCCAIWGSTFLFIRMGDDSTPPVWAAAVRLSLAAILFVAIALALRAPWPRGAQLEAALWFGAVDFGVSLPLLYWGEQQVPSGVSAVLYATVPLTTALFARMAGLERLRPRIVAASLVAILGVALLFSSSLSGRWEAP